jgi:hypothetical protein
MAVAHVLPFIWSQRCFILSQKYRMLVPMVDVVFADVAQPDQARIVGLNAQYFLKNGGNFVISIKASCIDSTAPPEAVFAREVRAWVGRGAAPDLCCMRAGSVLEGGEVSAGTGLFVMMLTNAGQEAAGDAVEAQGAGHAGAIRARPRNGGGRVPAGTQEEGRRVNSHCPPARPSVCPDVRTAWREEDGALVVTLTTAFPPHS